MIFFMMNINKVIIKNFFFSHFFRLISTFQKRNIYIEISEIFTEIMCINKNDKEKNWKNK